MNIYVHINVYQGRRTTYQASRRGFLADAACWATGSLVKAERSFLEHIMDEVGVHMDRESSSNQGLPRTSQRRGTLQFLEMAAFQRKSCLLLGFSRKTGGLPTVVMTDHQLLAALFRRSTVSARVLRCSLELQRRYKLEMRFVEGRANMVADELGREVSCADEMEPLEVVIEALVNTVTV